MNLLSYWASVSLTYCSFYELYRLVTWTPINFSFDLHNFVLFSIYKMLASNHAQCSPLGRESSNLMHFTFMLIFQRFPNLFLRVGFECRPILILRWLKLRRLRLIIILRLSLRWLTSGFQLTKLFPRIKFFHFACFWAFHSPTFSSARKHIS